MSRSVCVKKAHLIHGPYQAGREHCEDEAGDQLEEEAVEPQVEAEEEITTTELKIFHSLLI